MKKIRKIALKKARILSNEEMKHLFGGSGVTPGSGCTMNCPNGVVIFKTLSECSLGCSITSQGLVCKSSGYTTTYSCADSGNSGASGDSGTSGNSGGSGGNSGSK